MLIAMFRMLSIDMFARLHADMFPLHSSMLPCFACLHIGMFVSWHVSHVPHVRKRRKAIFFLFHNISQLNLAVSAQF
jgi:fluoride ion exporter CrcB/FEX